MSCLLSRVEFCLISVALPPKRAGYCVARSPPTRPQALSCVLPLGSEAGVHVSGVSEAAATSGHELVAGGEGSVSEGFGG